MRRAWWCVVPSLLVSGLAGCFGTSGTADENLEDGGLDGVALDSTSGVDTGSSPDSALTTDSGLTAETGPGTDTGTEPADTGTAPTDTGTTPTDTGTTPTDTGTPPTDTGPVAELSCTLASGPTTGSVDLSAGTLDWAHWGLVTKDSWDHKSGGTFFTGRGTTKGGFNTYGSYPVSWTWSGGTPTASMPGPIGTLTGIFVGNKDEGFTFDVALTTTERTLVTWLARNGTTTSVKVSSSDAGIAPFTTTISASGASGNVPANLTCLVRGASTSSKVTVEIMQTNSGGYTSLLSAVVK